MKVARIECAEYAIEPKLGWPHPVFPTTRSIASGSMYHGVLPAIALCVSGWKQGPVDVGAGPGSKWRGRARGESAESDREARHADPPLRTRRSESKRGSGAVEDASAAIVGRAAGARRWQANRQDSAIAQAQSSCDIPRRVEIFVT